MRDPVSISTTPLAVLPRGGLGDLLYHALFAKHVEQTLPQFSPVVCAPAYGEFITSLLGVRQVCVNSFLTDVSNGLNASKEVEFFKTLLTHRGGYIASFINDAVDHGLARVCGLRLFDNGHLGNSLFFFEKAATRFSRYGLNQLIGYRRNGRVNPWHMVDRQRNALLQHGTCEDLAASYSEIWTRMTSASFPAQLDSRLILIFPETARPEKNLSLEQIEQLVRQLRSEYRIRIFTRTPEIYNWLEVETAGFQDRTEPLRQIRKAAAVITADTFSAHLAGLCGTPTYTIYNFAYKPRWCEYWGAPFNNVLHFEGGAGYRLDPQFRAMPVVEDSPIFNAALNASSRIPEPQSSTEMRVLTGFAARSV